MITSLPPPRTIRTLSMPSVNTSMYSMSEIELIEAEMSPITQQKSRKIQGQQYPQFPVPVMRNYGMHIGILF